MKLYHGSNVEIDLIDLSKGKKGKDFGFGFYLSENYMQAVKMSEIVTQREACGIPTVTTFSFDETSLQHLTVKRFDGYTKEWAEFVLANRQNRSDNQLHSYDVVIGPIADDAVGVQIRRLMRGYISFEVFLDNIKYVNPTIQYFFGTESAIKLLQRI